MKTIFLFASFIGLSGAGFAQERDGRILITPASENYPTESFSKEHYKVISPKVPQHITTQMRDSWFQEADLQKEVADWDHLSKDMLYMSAVGLSEERYYSKYAQLPHAKLKKLRQLLLRKGIKA